MTTFPVRAAIAVAAFCGIAAGGSAGAHSLRPHDVKAPVLGAALQVTPSVDWNRLSIAPGPSAESWTLDGEQLNDLTFFAVDAGKPLLRERSRKRDPLPKFTTATLLIEVPELLEGTIRSAEKIGEFTVTSKAPTRFLGQDGIGFTYDYVDSDQLVRRGEARAAIVKGRLYMIKFDAPRLYYFDRALPAFRAIADSAALS